MSATKVGDVEVSISTIINLAAAAGTCFAAYYTALNAKVTQKTLEIASESGYDGVKPLLDFRKAEDAGEGEYTNPKGERTAGDYSFSVKNIGLGSAILGDNPFREPSGLEVTIRELNRDLGERKIVVVQDNPFKNTLRPNECIVLKCGAGYEGETPMGDEFELQPMYYSDVIGRFYETKITIRASGDVISVITKMIDKPRSANSEETQ